jgi:hypothetical protein
MMIMVSGPAKKYHGRKHMGWLLNPRAGASIQTIVQSGMLWACDNDCFKQLHRAAYLRMLCRVAGQPRLQWVVVPDVVADARATLARFRLWLPVLRYYGFAGTVGGHRVSLHGRLNTVEALAARGTAHPRGARSG